MIISKEEYNDLLTAIKKDDRKVIGQLVGILTKKYGQKVFVKELQGIIKQYTIEVVTKTLNNK
jgi:hypothetical protein